MIKEVKILALALKDNGGDIRYFVSSEIFDKRRKQTKIYSSPVVNLHNNGKQLKLIVEKMKVQKIIPNYEIVLVEQIVKIDLSLIYENGMAQIDKVGTDRVYISLIGGEKKGHQYFNNDKCILSKEIKEFEMNITTKQVA